MFIRSLQYLLLVTGMLFILMQVFSLNATADSGGNLIVLIPDDFSVKGDSRADAWVDAAREEGFGLVFMHDSDFMALGAKALNHSAFIMPDQIHKKASDKLIAALKKYVSRGGNLMLVYDAGSLTATGVYPTNPDNASPIKYSSRFGELAGVDYLFYEEFYEAGMINNLVGIGPVLGIEKMLWELQVQPGKSIPYTGPPAVNAPTYVSFKGIEPDDLNQLKFEHNVGARLDVGNKILTKKQAVPMPSAASTKVYQISAYAHEVSNYRSFVTRNRGGQYAGEVLLSSPYHGVVAGLNSFGAGKVLFVNLSLSYLKGQTDGMLMHGFLHYFGDTILGLPRLANVPKGTGGLVFNWHFDDLKAVEVSAGLLDKQGVWDRGHYSMHFTAGPDVNYAGDGLGMDIANSYKAQEWLRYFAKKGHQVASHGGWIHNYYGLNGVEGKGAEFEKYLVLNHEAIDGVLGHKATEYSAPLGNNPLWAMEWLQRYGILGYYSSGHTGMGPTRAYRDGKPVSRSMWAFPVSPLGQYATFEEFSRYGVPNAEVTHWYDALMDFVVHNHTSRLIYAHPAGAVRYADIMKALLDRADAYMNSGSFEWYTMTELAKFMTNRDQVSWQVTEDRSGLHSFKADHPVSLKDQAWILPKCSYGHPKVVFGKAKVSEDKLNWIVTAEEATSLQFVAKRNPLQQPAH